MTAELKLREMASFANCYTIENSRRIRLSNEETLIKTHQAVQESLISLMQIRGDQPELRQIKQNLQIGPSKNPVYTAGLDVLRAAFVKMLEGSWTIYGHFLTPHSHLIWKDVCNQQVKMRAFTNEAELNGLKATVMDASLKVDILQN